MKSSHEFGGSRIPRRWFIFKPSGEILVKNICYHTSYNEEFVCLDCGEIITPKLDGLKADKFIMDEAAMIPKKTWVAMDYSAMESKVLAGLTPKTALKTSEVLVRGFCDKGHFVNREVKEALASPTCPHCLVNPDTERIFSKNDFSSMLYEAKFRGIIDANTLVQLLELYKL